MSRILSPRLAEMAAQMPEASHGANRVRVKLKDGRSYASVWLAGGKEIIKIENSVEIPFEAEDVVSMESEI